MAILATTLVYISQLTNLFNVQQPMQVTFSEIKYNPAKPSQAVYVEALPEASWVDLYRFTCLQLNIPIQTSQPHVSIMYNFAPNYPLDDEATLLLANQIKSRLSSNLPFTTTINHFQAWQTIGLPRHWIQLA